jgi:ribosomal protein L6P/L9E
MIGRRLIKFANEVSIHHVPAKKVTGTTAVTVKGPLGELNIGLPGYVNLNVIPATEPDAKITCSVTVADPKIAKQRAMWGTSRALLSNMIIGVHEGYTVPLRLEGVGYRVFFIYIMKRHRWKKESYHLSWGLQIQLSWTFLRALKYQFQHHKESYCKE